MNFVAGNRVRVISGVFKGEVGTVIKYDNYAYLINFDNKSLLNLDQIHFTPSDLELYEKDNCNSGPVS